MRLHLLRHVSFVSTVGLVAAALHGACSPDSGVGTLPSSGATTGSGGSGGGGQVEPDGGQSDDASRPPLPDPDAACALVTETAVALPLNLYIMMDKSSSMAGGNKWDSAEAGLTAFVNNPRFAGTHVALRFFPREADTVPVCDPNAYQQPLVPFAPLSVNAADIVRALGATEPDGASTPIYPALGGALLKGIEVAQNNPGEASAVLLVTDGQPQGPAPSCFGVNPESGDAIAELAGRAADYDPPVRTYVIGLPGANQTIANQIAAAGGTDSAVLIGATNLAVEFQTALAKVTGEALPCEYEVPSQVAGGDVSFGDVNVLFALDGAQTDILPQSADCAGPGWRYDDASRPTRLLLCPATCAAAKDASAAQLQILLGCQTVIL